ncbi:flavodoxin domain-containing protein [Halodesulfovibrio aestuarii]|uniref:Flavodoxin domain-containing protein n=1 Tax=Halodesulfovibrio aestuarii TaxID=126333 RepID=A0A8G2C8H4_9BACT|nr:flavodoxin domain-containing protein [Halodesulfovibrio aestuarii]SHI81701.1 Flavodoxin domain-containing protein [Halodesulfovibrio aestuarii]
MNILNLYASLNGQTEKVAVEIEKAVTEGGHAVTTVNVKKNGAVIDLLAYDLTFIGSGVYTWLPGKAMLSWIENQMSYARQNDLILPGSPMIHGKFACVYCTYAGPHTGVDEAVPAIKYMGQLFAHHGITVADEWSIPGAFVPEKMWHYNTSGRLGNIEGRPNSEDLRQVREKTKGLISSLLPSFEEV